MKSTHTMLWVSGNGSRGRVNDKTGPIPAGYVGDGEGGNHYDANRESCEGCPLLASECYFHNGNVKRALFAIGKADKRDREKGTGVRYKLSTALGKRSRMARYVRGAVGGDPRVFSRETVEGWIKEIEEHGLVGMLLYTHFWESSGSHLRGLSMASCDTLEEADRAVEAGWRAAVVLPVKGDGRHRRVRNVPKWEGESPSALHSSPS